MKERFNGRSFDITLKGRDIAVSKYTLDITDNAKHVKRKGLPGGWGKGDVEAKGTIELDIDECKRIIEVAKRQGIFRVLKLSTLWLLRKPPPGHITLKFSDARSK